MGSLCAGARVGVFNSNLHFGREGGKEVEWMLSWKGKDEGRGTSGGGTWEGQWCVGGGESGRRRRNGWGQVRDG